MSPEPSRSASAAAPSHARRTHLYHFTHIEHLMTIVDGGIVADTTARGGLLRHEAGAAEIKDRRRRIGVPAGVGGVVADYVPFYFAPRSPMLSRRVVPCCIGLPRAV